MKLYLTGGSGFLAHHLLPRLRAAGHTILTPRSREVDLLSLDAVVTFLQKEKPDAIVHLAAYYGGIGINQAEPASLFFRNTVMAANLFEAAARAGVPRIVPVGSSCAYPGHLGGDLKEEDLFAGRCHPSVEAYGYSKRLQLVAQAAYHQQHGLSSCHLVLTNLYGEHDEFGEYRAHVAAALIKKFCDTVAAGLPRVVCWGDGSPVREFLYAGDAAELIARVIDAPHDDRPINVGTGAGTRISDLVKLLVELTGFRGEVVWDTSKPNGVARKVMDVTRMKQTFHWSPPTDLRTGLARTIDWYRRNSAADRH